MLMNLRDRIAQRLHELCAGGGEVSQSALARASGVSQTAIGKILHAKVDAGLGTVESLAAGIGVPPLALLVSQDEWTMLEAFRQLEPHEQANVTSAVRKLLKLSAPEVLFEVDMVIPIHDEAKGGVMTGLNRPEKPRRIQKGDVSIKIAAVNGRKP